MFKSLRVHFIFNSLATIYLSLSLCLCCFWGSLNLCICWLYSFIRLKNSCLGFLHHRLAGAWSSLIFRLFCQLFGLLRNFICILLSPPFLLICFALFIWPDIRRNICLNILGIFKMPPMWSHSFVMGLGRVNWQLGLNKSIFTVPAEVTFERLSELGRVPLIPRGWTQRWAIRAVTMPTLVLMLHGPVGLSLILYWSLSEAQSFPPPLL